MAVRKVIKGEQSIQEPSSVGVMDHLTSREERAIGITLVVSLALSALALILFAWLADEVMDGGTAVFDNGIRTAVHGLANPALTHAMFLITHLGDPNTLTLLCLASIFVFLYWGWNRGAAWLSVTMAGAIVLNTTLKLTFRRIRPEPFFGSMPDSYSFPSGHSLGSFCLYAILAGLIIHRVQNKILRIAVGISAALLIAVIGFSRIYLGVHYPSDVLAGYAAAAIWVGSLITIDRFWRRRSGLRAR